MNGFSLSPDMLHSIFTFAKPMGHYEDPEELNLGFGFLYYGLVRALRPSHVLVIGSGFGFSVVCLALGLKDNHKGALSFVDPSYDVLRHGPFKTLGGRGMWKDPQTVCEHFKRFDVHPLVTHYKSTSEDFFADYETCRRPSVDLAFVDGNHAYKHVRHDFLQVVRRMSKNGYVLLHDTNILIREKLRHSGVKRWLALVKEARDSFEVLDFPFSSGLALIRLLRDDAWKRLDLSS
jgi:predicted O-methyltransferase YrrM